jgi:hypothetical protein
LGAYLTWFYTKGTFAVRFFRVFLKHCSPSKAFNVKNYLDESQS